MSFAPYDALRPQLEALIGRLADAEGTEHPTSVEVGQVAYVFAMGSYRRGVVTKLGKTRAEVAYTTASSGGRIFRKSVPVAELRVEVTADRAAEAAAGACYGGCTAGAAHIAGEPACAEANVVEPELAAGIRDGFAQLAEHAEAAWRDGEAEAAEQPAELEAARTAAAWDTCSAVGGCTRRAMPGGLLCAEHVLAAGDDEPAPVVELDSARGDELPDAPVAVDELVQHGSGTYRVVRVWKLTPATAVRCGWPAPEAAYKVTVEDLEALPGFHAGRFTVAAHDVTRLEAPAAGPRLPISDELVERPPAGPTGGLAGVIAGERRGPVPALVAFDRLVERGPLPIDTTYGKLRAGDVLTADGVTPEPRTVLASCRIDDTAQVLVAYADGSRQLGGFPYRGRHLVQRPADAELDRCPYVGRGADGARRSAEIDRSELETLPTHTDSEAEACAVIERRQQLEASLAAWERQAERLELLETELAAAKARGGRP